MDKCFNPHPAFGPGATWPGLRGSSVGLRFQSSPGLRAGCYHPAAAIRPAPAWFQSSPGLRAGCYVHRRADAVKRLAVSILTRPSGRVLPGGKARIAARVWEVSILTRPSGRVLPPRQSPRAGHHLVSILTRPSGRVLPRPPASCARHWCVSILTRPSGRVLPGPPIPLPCASWRFNPHPAFGPGATGANVVAAGRGKWFQSSPGLRAGCYLRLGTSTTPVQRFQSSPGLRAGCYEAEPDPYADPPPGFNPHPAFGPGATAPPPPLDSQI